MAYFAVVQGAILRCDKGSRPSVLNATVPMTPSVDGKPVATILDNKPDINVMPFGVCSITKRSCVPVTPIPWVPGETSIPLPSLFPILTEISLLPCEVGGIIEVENPGQSILLVDSTADPNALREIRDFLQLILKLRTALEFVLDIGFGLGELFLDRWAAKTLGMARDAFKSIFGLNFKSLRWRLGQLKMSWNYLKKVVKIKVAAKLLGRLGNLLGVSSIVYDFSTGDTKGGIANTIGLGAGLVCAYFAAPTVVGVVACVGVDYGVSKFARDAIDNPKKAMKDAVLFTNPVGQVVHSGKLLVDHRDDIMRGAEKVWKEIPKPKRWPF